MSSQSLDTVHVSFSLDCHWVTLSKDPRFKYANSIRKFLKKMLNNFRRLARMTKNELSFEDLQSESGSLRMRSVINVVTISISQM
jgi:hypothetical protein